MYRSAETAATAGFWMKMRALAWTFPLAFLLHFLLIFTRRSKQLKSRLTYVLIYGPAILFAAIDFNTYLITGRPEMKSWGFSYGIPDSWVNWICNGWTAVLGGVSLVLILVHYVRSSDVKKRRQAKFIALGMSLPIVGGIASEIVLPELHIRIPELTSVSGAWLALIIGYAIWKYELFTINPAMAAENILSTMNEMFILFSPDGTIVRLNEATLNTLGYQEKELVGRPLGTLYGDEAANRAMFEAIRERGSVRSVETVGLTKQGAKIPIVVSATTIKDRRGRLLGIVGIARDISDRKRLEEDLRALSIRDDLTGLYNRRGFLTLAEHHRALSGRTGKKMMLLYADLDEMKTINDTYGHAAGDAALVSAARILKETFRSSDIIARIGGDEFVVLAGEASESCSELMRSRLEEKVGSASARTDFPWKISFSLGMVCYDPEHPSSIEELLAKADEIMYARKKRKQEVHRA